MKKTITLAITFILLLGLATASILTVFGVVDTRVSVQQAVVFAENNGTELNRQFDIIAGDSETIWIDLHNRASVDAKIIMESHHDEGIEIFYLWDGETLVDWERMRIPPGVHEVGIRYEFDVNLTEGDYRIKTDIVPTS